MMKRYNLVVHDKNGEFNIDKNINMEDATYQEIYKRLVGNHVPENLVNSSRITIFIYEMKQIYPM
jgi:hypothetical protein